MSEGAKRERRSETAQNDLPQKYGNRPVGTVVETGGQKIKIILARELSLTETSTQLL